MNYEANYYAAPGLKNVALPYNEKKASSLIDRICDKYGVTLEELVGPCRKRDLVFVRHLAMTMLRRETSMTLQQVGDLFNRDHTSVIHAVACIEDYIQTDSFGRREEIISFY